MKKLLISLVILNLSGCGMLGYTYEPSFFAKPKYYDSDPIEPIAMPEVPAAELHTVEYIYRSDPTALQENNHFTYTRKNKNLAKGTSTSIVVIMPNQGTPLSKDFDKNLVEEGLKKQGFAVKSLKLGAEETAVSEQIKLAKNVADYAFLINELSAYPRQQREFVKLDSIDSFQGTLSQLKQQIPANKQGLIQTRIPAPGYQASFRAKLIDLKTGSIVWIGKYSRNSSDIKDFQITYSYEKFTANDKQITNKVKTFNERLSEHNTELEQAKKDYAETYEQASTEKEFEDEGPMLLFAKMAKKAYRKAENFYINVFESGTKLPQEKEKVESSIQWTYDYNLPKPKISPSLDALAQPPLAPNQSSHIQQLVEATVSPLIQAIKLRQDGPSEELASVQNTH